VPKRILGISAYYHDSAACLVEDGRFMRTNMDVLVLEISSWRKPLRAR
jgi:hypothetical protein